MEAIAYKMLHDSLSFWGFGVNSHPPSVFSHKTYVPSQLAVAGAVVGGTGGAYVGASASLRADQIHALATASLSGPQLAMRTIREWQSFGHNLEEIYLGGIAPAARLLGDWWLSDQMCFSDVTIGSFRLQQALRELSPEFLKDAIQGSKAKRMLLLNAPGSQHTLGSDMAVEFFRRGGWQVSGIDSRDEATVMRLLYTEWYDLVGFSIASDRQIEAITTLIQKVRSISANADIRIILGGPMITLNQGLVKELGADCACADAREAQMLASEEIQNCKPYH
jgi:methanogenic corrinoid protein MtbC1